MKKFLLTVIVALCSLPVMAQNVCPVSGKSAVAAKCDSVCCDKKADCPKKQRCEKKADCPKQQCCEKKADCPKKQCCEKKADCPKVKEGCIAGARGGVKSTVLSRPVLANDSALSKKCTKIDGSAKCPKAGAKPKKIVKK